MKLKCPRCGERAYRVSFQTPAKGRAWVGLLDFVWCPIENCIVRVHDGVALSYHPDAKVPDSVRHALEMVKLTNLVLQFPHDSKIRARRNELAHGKVSG